ncbi:virulence protein RhuM/Fic/DOC family protein [Dyadobacter sp. CY261]|uniref:virulence protein RhuM/Fic/DOC family protein n=1 Tax=Dyadobacter sp. CY261 TaxID=2907203 RepID=UPI001F1D3A12|nr:virulence protein RhuM/Fic/DOC family protein [Dyadobacter sp. CY261]MCF0073584.1 virulence protein RhuM/Fic/DOC family protein [Dyadobacter sp. CY261]
MDAAISSPRGEIFLYESEEGKMTIQVQLQNDTVWLTQAQMAELFGKERSVISKHISNVFKEGELDANTNVQKMHNWQSVKPTAIFSLDTVISVGYRVKSAQGTKFRIWANRILKEYLIKGFATQEKLKLNQLQSLKKTVALLANVIQNKELTAGEATGLIQVVTDYAYALDILDRYDHQTLPIDGVSEKELFVISYEEAMSAIQGLRDKFGGHRFFGNEKDESFKSSINTIYQTFDGIELYPSVEEKAAQLLYFIIKNHSFTDGNKRIAALMFVWFMERNGILYRSDGSKRLADNALVALTLMIAESNTSEKEIMVRVVVSLINQKN